MSSRVAIIIALLLTVSSHAEHRRDGNDPRTIAPTRAIADESPGDGVDEEAVPKQLELAVRQAERAIAARNQGELLSAIMMLLPYYYAENPPSGEASETDQLLRELLAQRSTTNEPASAPPQLKDQETEFFSSVGKVEAPPSESIATPAPREAIGQGIDAPTAATPENNRPDVKVETAANDAVLAAGADAPLAGSPPANKRKARAKSKNVATRLMTGLLESLKASKMADAAAKETTPVGIKPAGAPASPKLATLQVLSPQAEAEGAAKEAHKAAPLSDKLHWLGWAVVFILLVLRQLHWMTTRGRKQQ